VEGKEEEDELGLLQFLIFDEEEEDRERRRSLVLLLLPHIIPPQLEDGPPRGVIH